MLKNQLGNDPGSDSTEGAGPPGAAKKVQWVWSFWKSLNCQLEQVLHNLDCFGGGGHAHRARNRLEVKLKPTSRFQCLGLQGDTGTEEVLGALSWCLNT